MGTASSVGHQHSSLARFSTWANSVKTESQLEEEEHQTTKSRTKKALEILEELESRGLKPMADGCDGLVFLKDLIIELSEHKFHSKPANSLNFMLDLLPRNLNVGRRFSTVGKQQAAQKAAEKEKPMHEFIVNNFVADGQKHSMEHHLLMRSQSLSGSSLKKTMSFRSTDLEPGR